jgi:osmotically-inducible protein OsmY
MGSRQGGQYEGGYQQGEYGGYGYGRQSTLRQSRRPGRFTGKGPKGYRRGDERIQEEVNEALTQDGEVDATNIEVKVQNGVVTLTGTVTSRQAKRDAEDLAEDVSGVREVENRLRVENEFGSEQQSYGREQQQQSNKETESSRSRSSVRV